MGSNLMLVWQERAGPGGENPRFNPSYGTHQFSYSQLSIPHELGGRVDARVCIRGW